MRVEDPRLVTGSGKYAADWSLPGQLHAHFVRSDRAHAEIVSVNAGAAFKHPAVKGVFTGADAVRAGYRKGDLKVVLRQLMTYHRDDKGNVVKKDDHGPDALLCAMLAFLFIDEFDRFIEYETAHAAEDGEAGEVILL